MLLVPAAFTEVTGRAHWEILIRARAIENQAFVIAADQVGPHPPDKESFGGSMIVDPWGEVLARAPDEECFVAADLDLERQDEVREKLPEPRQPRAGRLPRPAEVRRLMATAPRQAPVDKRRLILDAAVRVFARQGFHHCRVSDVADEAGVAYGLVYHYFDSKEEILNTLFLERWEIMLEAIAEIDARDLPVRDKLYSIAGFIIDSYRHDPDLMKVIIVEVTRAANSFGAAPPRQDPRGLRPHRGDPRVGPRGAAPSSRGSRPTSPRCASTARSSSCSPAGSSGCCRAPTRSTSAPRDWWSRPSAAVSRPRPRRRPPPLLESAAMGNDMTKRLMWSGLLAGVGALMTILANRVAAEIWVRVFKEDPPVD